MELNLEQKNRRRIIRDIIENAMTYDDNQLTESEFEVLMGCVVDDMLDICYNKKPHRTEILIDHFMFKNERLRNDN